MTSGTLLVISRRFVGLWHTSWENGNRQLVDFVFRIWRCGICGSPHFNVEACKQKILLLVDRYELINSFIKEFLNPFFLSTNSIMLIALCFHSFILFCALFAFSYITKTINNKVAVWEILMRWTRASLSLFFFFSLDYLVLQLRIFSQCLKSVSSR